MEPDVNAAIKKGFFQQVRFLLQLGGSANCRDDQRRTPLMNCALIEDETWGVGVARTLIEKGAAMRYRDRRGMNSLHYACIYGRKQLVELLLSSPDFDINQPDIHGNTPLHYAAMKGNATILEVLLAAMEKYKLGVDTANNHGFTALMQAWRSDNEHCARILLFHGADIKPRDLVHIKTAEEHEEDYRRRQEARKEKADRRSRGFFFNLTQQKRPSSAMSAFSRSNMESRQSSVQTRIRPASSRLLRRRTPNDADNSNIEEMEVDYLQKAEKDRLAGKLIRSASLSDIRNKPEQLLNILPVECFVKETQFQILNNHRPSFGVFGDKGTTTNNNNSWKSEIKKMYSAFQYQFTSSYRKPARPKQSEAVEIIEEVAPSPIPSEYDGGEKSKKNRKSASKGLQEDKQEKKLRKMSGRSLSRKGSTVSLKSQQAGVDCSSNESLNSSKKGSKKRTMDNNHELSELGVDKATKTDKNGKARSRKISAALEDHVTTTDQSNTSTASRGLTIPIVKEPIGQDQLGAIRE
ncbi:hypothetical protein LSH36_647g01004 [Paralvinella palmiformis]|uniref:Uncharacterized protein n=1 Tax=Paralvinella palmiformis TaxID=53620 RepID=A0AAD9J3G1_9ANNE|nr:hypothetical protein LSH36_647g01004 [Paralvinella palmiformis]